ncbi:MAG: hypothetical protein IPH36_16885 [Saprospiraceae bacterium]|nr:hypothetical protein [Saprospiraceae bacterium]
MNTDQRPVNLDEMLKSYLVNAEAFLATPIKSAKTLLPIGSALLAGINAMDAQIVYSGIQNVSCALAGATARCYANIDQAGEMTLSFTETTWLRRYSFKLMKLTVEVLHSMAFMVR